MFYDFVCFIEICGDLKRFKVGFRLRFYETIFRVALQNHNA